MTVIVDPSFSPSQIRIGICLLTTVSWRDTGSTWRHNSPHLENSTLLPFPIKQLNDNSKRKSEQPASRETQHLKALTSRSLNADDVFRSHIKPIHAWDLFLAWQLPVPAPVGVSRYRYIYMSFGYQCDRNPLRKIRFGKKKGNPRTTPFFEKLQMALQTDATIQPASAWVTSLAFAPSNRESSNYLLESKGSPKSFDARKNSQENLRKERKELQVLV